MKKRSNKFIKWNENSYSIVAVLLSIAAAGSFDLTKVALLDFAFVFGTLGLLLGFGITVYTFIIQMAPSVLKKILAIVTDTSKHVRYKERMATTTRHLKENLQVIFALLVATSIADVLFSFASETCHFSIAYIHSNLLRFRQGIFLFSYMISFWCIYDLMATLFKFGEIMDLLLNKGEIE